MDEGDHQNNKRIQKNKEEHQDGYCGLYSKCEYFDLFKNEKFKKKSIRH